MAQELEEEDVALGRIMEIAKKNAGIEPEIDEDDEPTQEVVESTEESTEDDTEAKEVESDKVEPEAVETEEAKTEDEPAKEEAKAPEPDDTFFTEDLKDLIPVMDYKTIDERKEVVKQQLTQFKEVSATFKKLFDENPEAAALLTTLSQGKTFPEALAESGILDLIPSSEEPDYEEFQKAIKQNREKLTEKTALGKEFANNIQKSVAEVNEFYKDTTSPDIATRTKSLLDETLGNFQRGIVTKDLISILDKGITADAKIEKMKADHAKELKEQEIRIKNEKITKAKQAIASEPNVPNVSGKSTPAPKTSSAIKDWFAGVREIENERNI